MRSKKTTVNLSTANSRKLEQIKAQTGLTQSEIINNAIANIPIIYIGNQQTIAEIFFEIKKLLSENDTTNIREEVAKACQLLSLLMQKQEELMLSKGESIIS